MKVLHDYLYKVGNKTGDSNNVGIVILSNKMLDAAKTNRMMVLVHPNKISDYDEKALVEGCLFNSKNLSIKQLEIRDGLFVHYWILLSIVRVGCFENDTSEESLVECVSNIKSIMETGGTVVFVNSEKIESCFYEFFNRYFKLG
ncbi:hypothetical protein ACTFIY_005433 [Dictyostelium cf. discoideum]